MRVGKSASGIKRHPETSVPLQVTQLVNCTVLQIKSLASEQVEEIVIFHSTEEGP